MIEAAERILGVTAVEAIDDTPLGTGAVQRRCTARTSRTASSNSVMAAHYYPCSPGYLQAAATRLLAGSDFTWQDNEPNQSRAREPDVCRRCSAIAAVGRYFREANLIEV